MTMVAERGLDARGSVEVSPPVTAPVELPVGPLSGVALVTLTAATVLVAEIVATRMIAPYVGVTIETISAVIGCILAGMAIGNWTGGRIADSAAARRLLGGALVTGGALLVAAPAVIRALGPQVAGTKPMSAVALATGAFFLPSALISTTGPVVLKGLARDSTRLGRAAGCVAAAGTVGALVGNFGAGFVLVGSFPTDRILVAAGSLVAALGTTLLTRRHGGRSAAIAVTVGCAAALFAAGSFAGARMPCSRETQYVCLDIVVSGSGEYTFRSDVYESSVTDVEDPGSLRLSYARDVAGVVSAAVEDPRRFLYVGAGGYTLPLHFADAYPDSTHSVLEIDAELVEAVSDAIGLRDHADRVVTIVGDARQTIDDLGDAEFDVVTGDAFSGLSVPWHLTTAEFLAEVRARLAPDGIYVMNVVDSGTYRLARAEVQTLSALFDDVVVLARPAVFFGADGPSSNVVIVAGSDLPDADEIWTAATRFGSASIAVSGAELAAFAEGEQVLQDLHAPADQLVGRP